MKRLFLVFTILFCITSANAQNPFDAYGYTPKIATLSNGKYNEFHDLDTIVQIGTVLFNTQTKQIVAFLQVDTLYSEATLQPDIVSMWISPDPLADEYPSWSPYAYCTNNPVMLVDPNGMESIIPPTQEEYEKYNISPAAQQRFESILHNIESFTENKEFMNAFSQTTGLNADEIKEYLTYGTGPKANIIDGSWANAMGANSFNIGADIINYMGSIASNDENKLGTQAFGTAMVIIDELSHNGDMAYNQTSTSTGETKYTPGKQNWSLSTTFHRGGDSQIFGFGIETSTVATNYTNRIGRQYYSGEILVSPPFSIIQNKYPGMPKVPMYSVTNNIAIGLKLLK